MGFRGWITVRQILRKLLWIDAIHGALGEQLWHDVEREGRKLERAMPLTLQYLCMSDEDSRTSLSIRPIPCSPSSQQDEEGTWHAL